MLFSLGKGRSFVTLWSNAASFAIVPKERAGYVGTRTSVVNSASRCSFQARDLQALVTPPSRLTIAARTGRMRQWPLGRTGANLIATPGSTIRRSW